MSLKEKLAEDLKSSMKNKDTVRKNTVQLVRTAILQVEKDNKVTLDDEDILEVIAKQLKQRKDSLPEYEKSPCFGGNCKAIKATQGLSS